MARLAAVERKARPVSFNQRSRSRQRGARSAAGLATLPVFVMTGYVPANIADGHVSQNPAPALLRRPIQGVVRR